MISICIPIYNFDVTQLVDELARQVENSAVECELILIDDCSQPGFKERNEAACRPHHYVELKQNIGRSRIRNLFLEYARFDYLLFLDCDSLLPSPNFLKLYLDNLAANPQVISGGRIYPKEKPGRERLLSWKFGVERESKKAGERQKMPNKSFMTNNFLVRKTVLADIRFDERLSGYGHEDTLFGIELQKREIPVSHIENPVLNGDIETNPVFLQKTEEGLKNLDFIEQNSPNPELLRKNVNLLHFRDQLKSRKLLGFVRLVYWLFRRPIRWSLERGFISLRLFDLYKLGFYTSLK